MCAISERCSARQATAPATTRTTTMISVRLSHGRITMRPMLARIVFLLMLFARASYALVPLPPQPSPVPWPTVEWPTGAPDCDLKKLDALLRVTDAPQEKLGETRAVVIVHQGKLVAERYMTGFTRNTPLISWSMAKSVTQAMVGIVARAGAIDPDKPMGHPLWAGSDARSKIPWRWWLNMIDGQDYHEIGVYNQVKNDAARMLYGIGRLDVAGFGASLPLVHEP